MLPCFFSSFKKECSGDVSYKSIRASVYADRGIFKAMHSMCCFPEFAVNVASRQDIVRHAKVSI